MYDIGADTPHSEPVHETLEILRERSIAVRAVDIEVPPLDDPALIAAGAQHYSAMCSGCHLAPGMEESEIRAGLYPQPTNLAQRKQGESYTDMDLQTAAARQFWIIKHGIKLTAMPAWGTTHSDDAIWALVAFLQKLPELSAQDYKSISISVGGHQHGGGSQHGGETEPNHSAHDQAQDHGAVGAGHTDEEDAPVTPPTNSDNTNQKDGHPAHSSHAH